MIKNILYSLIVILILTACSPSESQVATSSAETELASPSDTPVPSYTPIPTSTITPSPSPTATFTLTPTPDLRVVDGDPALMVLSAEDISEEAEYFQTTRGQAKLWPSIYGRNWELIRDFGEEEASTYIELSGRIDGRDSVYVTYSKSPNTAEYIISEVVIFSTSAGPEIEQNGITKGTICNVSKDDIKPIDIDVDASVCYTKLTFIGEKTVDYHDVHGAYRNILFSVTAIGPENTLSEDIVIELAKLLVSKIKSFPLADEVTYTPY